MAAPLARLSGARYPWLHVQLAKSLLRSEADYPVFGVYPAGPRELIWRNNWKRDQAQYSFSLFDPNGRLLIADLQTERSPEPLVELQITDGYERFDKAYTMMVLGKPLINVHWVGQRLWIVAPKKGSDLMGLRNGTDVEFIWSVAGEANHYRFDAGQLQIRSLRSRDSSTCIADLADLLPEDTCPKIRRLEAPVINTLARQGDAD